MFQETKQKEIPQLKRRPPQSRRQKETADGELKSNDKFICVRQIIVNLVLTTGEMYFVSEYSKQK